MAYTMVLKRAIRIKRAISIYNFVENNFSLSKMHLRILLYRKSYHLFIWCLIKKKLSIALAIKNEKPFLNKNRSLYNLTSNVKFSLAQNSSRAAD